MNEALLDELEQMNSSPHNLTLPDPELIFHSHSLLDDHSILGKFALNQTLGQVGGGKAHAQQHFISKSQVLDLQKLRQEREHRPDSVVTNQVQRAEEYSLGINLSKSYIYHSNSQASTNVVPHSLQKNQKSVVYSNPHFFYDNSQNGLGKQRQVSMKQNPDGVINIQNSKPIFSDRFDFNQCSTEDALRVEDLLLTDEAERVESNLLLLPKSSRFEMMDASKNESRLRDSTQIYEVQNHPPHSIDSGFKSMRQRSRGERLATLEDDDIFSNQEVESEKYFKSFAKDPFEIKEVAAPDSQNLSNANNQDAQFQNSQPQLQTENINQATETQRQIIHRTDQDEYEDDFEDLDGLSEERDWRKPQVANSNMQGFEEENKVEDSLSKIIEVEACEDIEAHSFHQNRSSQSFSRKPFNQQVQNSSSTNKVQSNKNKRESIHAENLRNPRRGDNQYSSNYKNYNYLISSQQTLYAAGMHHITSNQVESPKNYFGMNSPPQNPLDSALADFEISMSQEASQSQSLKLAQQQRRPSFNSMEMGFFGKQVQNLEFQPKEESHYKAIDWANMSVNNNLYCEEINLDQHKMKRRNSQEQGTSQNSIMSNYISDSESRVLRSSQAHDINIIEINSRAVREQSSAKMNKQKSDDFYNQFDLDGQEEEEKFHAQVSQNSINLPLQYAQSEKILNKYVDEKEPLLQRGRNSVLEEVEDDDIVNQNSSKSSSKAQSQERQIQIENRLEIANHILQSFSQTSQENLNWNLNGLQIINQRQMLLGNNEEAQEEIKTESLQVQTTSKKSKQQSVNQGSGARLNQDPSLGVISNASAPSSVSSRRKRQTKETKHGTLKFTYFAASSLSDDRWLCPICLDIYEDAVETPCCHNLFCEECIKQTPTCPLCNLRINGQLKPNIPIRRLVNELSISCINEFCEDVIRKGDLEKHLKACPFTPITCPNNEMCGKIIRKEIESHKNEDCPFRIVECFLKCGLMLPLNDMDDHIAQDCPKLQVKCKNNCAGTIEKGEMDKHLSIDCPLQIVECPNKIDSLFEESCQVRLKRKEMETHKLTCNYRRVYCLNQKCGSIIIYKDLLSHDERCLFKIVDCDNNCKVKVQRQYLDTHKEVCENQLIRCSYYELGCKVEILRKYYLQHLQEESFNHSILFIEGQKKRNREMEELKFDFLNLRQNYDVEIQAMFLELHRLKDEMAIVKQKSGINIQSQNTNTHPNNSSSNGVGTKMILGSNAGLGMINLQRNRIEALNSSQGSTNYDQGRTRPFWLENNQQNTFNVERQSLQQNYQERERSRFSFFNNGVTHTQMPSMRWANQIESNAGNNSNAVSLAQSAQSFDNIGLGMANATTNRNQQKPPTQRQGWVEESNQQQQRQRQENQYRFGYWNLQSSGQNPTNNLSNSNQNETFSFITNQNGNQVSNNSNNLGENVNRRMPFTFHSTANNANPGNNNHITNQSRFTFNSNNQSNQNLQESGTYGQMTRYFQNQSEQNNCLNESSTLNRNMVSSEQDAENRKNQLALFLGSMNGSVDSIHGLSMIRHQNNTNSQIGLGNMNSNNLPQLNNDQLQSVHQQLFQSYQNSYNHLPGRESLDNNQEDQRMSFGFTNGSPQINHSSKAPTGLSNNNNNPLKPSGASPSSNFNQSNNLQGSQQSGMNLGGVVVSNSIAENTLINVGSRGDIHGLGGSINLDRDLGILNSNNSAAIENLGQNSLMLRSMGNIAGLSLNNPNKFHQDHVSQNTQRSNNMRNITISNQIATPYSRRQYREIASNLSVGVNGQAANQNQNRRLSSEGIGGMNDVSESQDHSQSQIGSQINILGGGINTRANNGSLGQQESAKPKNQQNIHAPNQDLDSSNVIYDDDFEIEEEKNNF